MTHFNAWVLVPLDASDIFREVGRRITPHRRDASTGATRWDDWWIGGRWEGKICGHSEQREFPDLGRWDFESNAAYEFDGIDLLLTRNAAVVSAISREAFEACSPCAIVDPDGRWHGVPGYPSYEAAAAWRTTAREILDANRPRLAVSLDCHV